MKKFTAIHVYDFDGTVVDSSHRYRTQIGSDGVERIDLQHWIDNEHKTLEDSLLPLADQYKADIQNPAVFVVVATARIWCNLSKAFAAREGVTPQHLIARLSREDNRGGAELKISGLNKLLENPVFENAEMHVFEDNTSYLKSLCDTFGAIGHYYPSKQGH